MKSERLPPYGDRRVSERVVKKNITEVRLEKIKTVVKQEEDLACWNELLRKILVDFQSLQNKLWKSDISSTRGSWTLDSWEEQMGYDIKIRLNKVPS